MILKYFSDILAMTVVDGENGLFLSLGDTDIYYIKSG